MLRHACTLREAIVGNPEQIERSLREAKDGGAAGVNVLSSALLFALRGQIIKLAAELWFTCDISVARNGG
jgi:hypothetical protein